MKATMIFKFRQSSVNLDDLRSVTEDGRITERKYIPAIMSELAEDILVEPALVLVAEAESMDELGGLFHRITSEILANENFKEPRRLALNGDQKEYIDL